VRLRNADGSFLTGGDVKSLSFTGSTTLPPKPIAWTVAANPPLGHSGNPALYSGFGNLRDEAIIKQVTVDGGTLTFDALWNEELGWDFGFVQVSTDGGATYTSLACTDTTTTTNPNALPTAKQNVPGFTGYSGGWKSESCSLAGYSGSVLLAFRTFNDPATLGESGAVDPGFWVDNVAIGSTVVSDGSTLTGWQSPTQVRPSSVSNFVVTIMSVNGNKITLEELPLNTDFDVKNKADVQKYVDKNASFVAAIVTYDDPSESSDEYAPYSLTVNGVVQPGGGL
jgi:bacillopeptidase F (M6 metalloprotease family)